MDLAKIYISKMVYCKVTLSEVPQDPQQSIGNTSVVPVHCFTTHRVLFTGGALNAMLTLLTELVNSGIRGLGFKDLFQVCGVMLCTCVAFITNYSGRGENEFISGIARTRG